MTFTAITYYNFVRTEESAISNHTIPKQKIQMYKKQYLSLLFVLFCLNLSAQTGKLDWIAKVGAKYL